MSKISKITNSEIPDCYAWIWSVTLVKEPTSQTENISDGPKYMIDTFYKTNV